MKTSFQTVPDTNILIASQNASETSPNREYFDRWDKEEFVLLYCKDTLREYIRKLLEKDVPKKSVQKLTMEILILGKEVQIEYFHFPKYPADPDDIPFLLCAENGEATHIITYDKHFEDLTEYCDFRICKPLEFLFELRAELEKSKHRPRNP
ncbi:MAG: hypothetical protein DRI57_22155 [Deltaproteobacteria bacterium]|nr:MAG: hypothetical protein DRI57_22155 [Deltaproteobacteria bacterium]